MILLPQDFKLFTDNRSGGSTITQQMIKIIYLNNSKTIKRKSNETFNDYQFVHAYILGHTS